MHTEETETVLMHKSPWMEQSKARMHLDWLLLLKPKLPEYVFLLNMQVFMCLKGFETSIICLLTLKYIPFQTSSLPQYHLSQPSFKGIAVCMLND